jgi:site-specific DNA-methyltransferase (adenine-specific)
MTPYYQDDACTIYHGDCRGILPTLGRFDLLLTDPPYGVTQQGWDVTDSVAEVVAASPLAVFTTGERLLAALIGRLPERYRHIWVWDRVNRDTDFLNASRRPLRSHELVAVFSVQAQYDFLPVKRSGSYITRRSQAGNGNGSYGDNDATEYGKAIDGLHPRSIIAFKGAKTNTQLHPTEKPVSLYEYLLQSYPADLTVDAWMGSGTTLVAAKNCGRRAVGIELEERYCEIAANRLSQGVLF